MMNVNDSAAALALFVKPQPSVRCVVEYRPPQANYFLLPLGRTAGSTQALSPDEELPCESTFERLAEERPSRLLDMLGGGLEPTDLTFAAEIAGRYLVTSIVVAPLLSLAGSADAIVREGALQGLWYHRESPEARDAISRLSHSDPSAGIRAIAAAMLEDEQRSIIGLYRIAKRLTSLESGDPEQVMKTEFRAKTGEPDLSLSCYEVASAEVARTCAEHYAGLGLTPKPPMFALDLTSLVATFCASPLVGTRYHFAFIDAAHRELTQTTEASLRAVATSLVGEPTRVTPDLTPCCKDYVRGRRTSGDSEWIPVISAERAWAKFGR